MKQQLTYDQVKRIEIGLKELAKRGNPFAEAVVKAIEGKSPAQMRDTLAGSYSRMYECLLTMGMAMDSKISPKLVQERLEKHDNH